MTHDREHGNSMGYCFGLREFFGEIEQFKIGVMEFRFLLLLGPGIPRSFPLSCLFGHLTPRY